MKETEERISYPVMHENKPKSSIVTRAEFVAWCKTAVGSWNNRVGNAENVKNRQNEDGAAKG